MKLIIETTDRATSKQIEAAYNLALNTTSVNSFIQSLADQLKPSLCIGRGGSHIWISSTNTDDRKAIVIL